MIYAKLLFSQLLPLGLGFVLLRRILRQKIPLVLQLALSYGLGLGLLTQWMMVLAACRISLRLPFIGWPLGAVILILARWPAGTKPSGWSKHLPPPQPKGVDWPAAMLIAYVVFMAVYVLWSALNIPVMGWDAVATHAFNGKVIYFERSLEFQKNFPHYTYPLHIPFLMAWVALNLGQWHDQFIKIISPGYFLAFLATQYYFIRRFSTRRWALLGLGLLVSSNFFAYSATSGYRDFTMLYYYCSVVILMLLWQVERDDGWLYLAALFTAFVSFVKMEGIGYVLILGLTFGFLLLRERLMPLRVKFKKMAAFILPALGIAGFYLLYKHWALAATETAVDGPYLNFDIHHIEFLISPESLGRVGAILGKFIENLLFLGNWNLLWLLCLIGLLSRPRNRLGIEMATMIFNLLAVSAIYIAGYSFTQHYVWVLENDSVLVRSILHSFPLATLLIVFSVCPLSDKTRMK